MREALGALVRFHAAGSVETTSARTVWHVKGYPEDLRSDRQRVRAANGPFGDFEYAAARVVARFTGDHVVIQDDNSSDGMPDLRIEHGDHTAYVEVTTDLDARYGQLLGNLGKTGTHFREIPERIVAPGLDRTWFLTVSPSTNLKELRQVAPYLLATSRSDLFKLGVVEICSKPKKDDSGLILLYPQGISGPTDVTWEETLGHLQRILSTPELEAKYKKLRATDGHQKHIFLGTTFTTPWALRCALSFDTVSLPPEDPGGLPSDITHLWIMDAPFRQRCLTWSAEYGWMETRKHWKTP